MRIDFMRKVDRAAGVPLCALATVIDLVRKPFSRRPDRPPRKILFIKLSELGAIVCAYPLISSVRRRYPRAEVFFLTFDRNREVFRFLNGVVPEKNIITLRQSGFFALAVDTVRAVGMLRKQGLDFAIDLEFFSRFTSLIAWVCAPLRAGFYRYGFEGLYRGSLLTHKVQYNPHGHITDTYASFADCLETGRKDSPEFASPRPSEHSFPRYASDPLLRAGAREKLARAGMDQEAELVLVNPGEGVLPEREWPLENFIELGKLVLSGPKVALVMAGTEGSREKADELCRRLGSSRCLNLAGQTSLGELMELLDSAKLLISNDCGIGHLAMLTGIRKCLFFGPESPEVFGPRDGNTRVFYSSWPCSPCLSALNHRKSYCLGNRCLQAIKPGEVWEAIRTWL